MIEHLNTF